MWNDNVLALTYNIRVLKLKQKGAMNIAEVTAYDKANEVEFVSVTAQVMVARLSRTRSYGRRGQDIHDGSNESKCIFTHVEKDRKYDTRSH